MEKYSSKNKELQNIVLIVDFVFLLSLEEIMKKYFQTKNLIITEADKFFKLKLIESQKKETQIILNLNIPGYNYLLLKKIDEIPNINNFITYYFEIKEREINSNNIHNIKNFLLYNPKKNINDFYLNIIETKSKIDDPIMLVIDPLYDREDLKLDIYEELHKYILILYKTYIFGNDENFLKKLFRYFFPKKEYYMIPIDIVDNKVMKETDSKILCKSETKKILYIKSKENNFIETKFKVNDIISNLNFIINVNSVADRNISCLIDSIPFQKNVKIKILIEQSCNIIHIYLKNIFKKAEFYFFNSIHDEKIKELKECISTYEKNEIKNENGFLSHLTENDTQKYDLIILENTLSTNNLFENEEKLKRIKNYLSEKGLFIIHLIVNNIYSRNNIYQILTALFKKVKILNEHELYQLNNVFSCFDY